MYEPVEKSSGVGCARVQRKAQILTCLFDQVNPENGGLVAHAGSGRAGWLTTGEIARCCNMSASPHFRQMLAELAYSQHIVGESEPYRSNMLVFWWRIHEDTRWSQEWIGVFDAYLNENAAATFGGIR